ncbi:MAG: DUF488 domain-containing protein [Acidimicrobiales bacterium]
MIRIKRIYDEPDVGDGQRVLVDRVWPRGVRKADAALDQWLPEVGPSDDLRRWFGHDPARWDEFQVRYRAELADNEHFDTLVDLVRQRPTTLLYGARDTEHNQAVVLAAVLAERQQ